MNQNQYTPNTPNPNFEKKPAGLARGLLNILLVFLESAITLVLRFDPKLRKLAYPLASENVVVCIRTYLPHSEIYATFGYRGVLLDDRLPASKTMADITINGYTFQLINMLTNHSSSSVDALQIRGEAKQIAQLKAFLTQLGVGGVIANVLQTIKGSQKKPTEEEKQQKQENYKAKIAEQQTIIDNLTIENHKLSTIILEMQSKQKTLKLALIIMGILAILAIIANFIW